MPRRQLGQASRQQPDLAGPPDRLPALPTGMAKPRLITTPAAQLHDRHARGALCLWRAGACQSGTVPEMAGARIDGRDAGGTAMSGKFGLRICDSPAQQLRADAIEFAK